MGSPRKDLEFDEKTIDVGSLSKDQCLRLLVQLQEGITGIDIQLNESKGKPKEDRTPGDRQWFNSAVAARKIKGNIRQKVQARLSVLNKAEKESNIKKNKAFTQLFLSAARRRLPQDLFNEIWEEAEAAVEVGQESLIEP
jgi:hypothetical protein